MAVLRRTRRLVRASLAIAAASLFGAASAEANPSVKAWISLEPAAGGHQQFVGHASATEPFAGRFELIGERQGAGGTSHVTQGGSFRVTGNETVRLSQLSFGDVASATHYSVRLRVFAGDEIVGTAEIVK